MLLRDTEFNLTRFVFVCEMYVCDIEKCLHIAPFCAKFIHITRNNYKITIALLNNFI